MDDLRRIFLGLCVAVVVLYAALGGVGTYTYMVAKDQRREAAVAAARADRLSQQLCKVYSRSRVVSNRTIREPLRISLETQAAVLYAAADDRGNDPDARRFYREGANRLEEMAQQILPVRAIPCHFDGKD